MTMMVFSVVDAADQQFNVDLAGTSAAMRLRYNPTMDRWNFDLVIAGAVVLYGRRIVPGTDLLGAFHFNVGALFCSSGQTPEPEGPGRNDLIDGSFRLYHAEQADVDRARLEIAEAQRLLLEAAV